MFNIPRTPGRERTPNPIAVSVESEFFTPAPGEEPGANNPTYQQVSTATGAPINSQARSGGYTEHALDSSSSHGLSTYLYIVDIPGNGYDPHFSGRGSTHGDSENFHEGDHSHDAKHDHDSHDALPNTSDSQQGNSHTDESHKSRSGHEEHGEHRAHGQDHAGHAEHAHRSAPGNTDG